MNFLEISGSITWQQAKAATGLQTTQQTQNVAATAALTVTAGNANAVYYATLTFTGNETKILDLTSLTGPTYNESVSANKVYAIALFPTVDTVKLTPDPSNGLQWFFGSATDSLTVQPNGLQVYAQLTGQTVDGTHKRIDLTSGSTGATCQVAIALGTP